MRTLKLIKYKTMKNTVFDIKEKISEYENLHPIIKFFSFKKRMDIYILVRSRFSDLSNNATYGMTPCLSSDDHYRELSEKYRIRRLDAEQKLHELQEKLKDFSKLI